MSTLVVSIDLQLRIGIEIDNAVSVSKKKKKNCRAWRREEFDGFDAVKSIGCFLLFHVVVIDKRIE